MKLEKILALSLALYACPKTEDETPDASVYNAGSSSENPCTLEGEVLFEDEFEGDSLDLTKWEEPCGSEYYGVRTGNLELTGGANGACILQSYATFTIDEKPLIFETRWKVREREGTDVFMSLLRYESEGIEPGYIGLVLNSETGHLQYSLGRKSCGINGELPDRGTTQFHSYRIITSENRNAFCIDGTVIESVGGSNCLPIGMSLNVDLTCQSADGREKLCEFDYVKLMK